MINININKSKQTRKEGDKTIVILQTESRSFSKTHRILNISPSYHSGSIRGDRYSSLKPSRESLHQSVLPTIPNLIDYGVQHI